MRKDEPQDPTEQDRTDDEARDTSEELSDEALENVSGGNMPLKNTTSPWGDVG